MCGAADWREALDTAERGTQIPGPRRPDWLGWGLITVAFFGFQVAAFCLIVGFMPREKNEKPDQRPPLERIRHELRDMKPTVIE